VAGTRVLRAVRWRLGSSLVMLVVALSATTAAAVGPIYLAAAKDSVLRASLSSSPVFATGLTVSPSAGSSVTERAVEAAIERLPVGPDATHWYGRPILEGLVGGKTIAADRQPYAIQLLYRTGFCGHLDLVAGHCPQAPLETILSTRSLHAIGSAVGARLPITLTGGARLDLDIVGSYIAPTGGPTSLPAYWWEETPFLFGSGTPEAPYLDSAFVAPQTLRDLPRSAIAYFSAQVPLRDSVIHTAAIAPLRAALRAYDLFLETHLGLSATTPLGALFAGFVADAHLMSAIVAVAVAELVLLCLVVLYGVVVRTADSRRQEVALARLRGFSSFGTLRVAMTEPSLLVVAAIPFGILAGWGIVALLGSIPLGRGVPVALNGYGVLAALGAAAGGIVAVGLGSANLLAMRLGSRGEDPGRSSRNALVVDVAILVLAGAGLIELSSVGVLGGSHTNPLAALAPGLLAAAAAVIGMRAIPIVSRLGVRATAPVKGLSLFLASRQLARRPSLSRHLLPVTLSFGLVVFAGSSYLVANHNRARAGLYAVGAAEVLDVVPRGGVDLETVVDRAIPDRHEAMAVVQLTASTGNLLAVEAHRLAGIAFIPSLGAARLARLGDELAPKVAPSVFLTGSELRATVSEPVGLKPAVGLEVTVFDEVYEAETEIDLGALRPGTHTYVASTEGACATACRLVSIEPLWSPPASYSPPSKSFSFAIDSLVGTTPGGTVLSSARLSPASAFELTGINAQGTGAGAARGSLADKALGRRRFGLEVAVSESELDVDVSSGVLIVPADVPAVIPTVFGSALAAVDDAIPRGPSVPIEGFDGNTLAAEPIAVVTSLPRVGDDASLVDLAFLSRSQSGIAIGTEDEVWLSARASPRLLHRLERGGLVIVGQQSAAAARSVLNHSGVALSFLLFVFTMVVAVLLALGSTVFAVLVDARRRVVELAALRSVGVPLRTLRRSLVTEQAVVLGLGALLGLGAGLGAASLALSSMPEFSHVPLGLPLVFALPLGAVLAIWGVATVLLGIGSFLAVSRVTSSITPETLRQEPE